MHGDKRRGNSQDCCGGDGCRVSYESAPAAHEPLSQRHEAQGDQDGAAQPPWHFQLSQGRARRCGALGNREVGIGVQDNAVRRQERYGVHSIRQGDVSHADQPAAHQ